MTLARSRRNKYATWSDALSASWRLAKRQLAEAQAFDAAATARGRRIPIDRNALYPAHMAAREMRREAHV